MLTKNLNRFVTCINRRQGLQEGNKGEVTGLLVENRIILVLNDVLQEVFNSHITFLLGLNVRQQNLGDLDIMANIASRRMKEL